MCVSRTDMPAYLFPHRLYGQLLGRTRIEGSFGAHHARCAGGLGEGEGEGGGGAGMWPPAQDLTLQGSPAPPSPQPHFHSDALNMGAVAAAGVCPCIHLWHGIAQVQVKAAWVALMLLVCEPDRVICSDCANVGV